MNRTLLTRVLTDAHHFASDALHAAKQGLETQALVSAEAAHNRLAALLSTYKNVLPPQSLCLAPTAQNATQTSLSCTAARQNLFTTNGN